MEKNFTKKHAVLTILFFAIIYGLDQWTKALAITYLKNQAPITIIPGVFKLQYLENRGAAFGMMQGQQMFFTIMALIVVLGISYFYYKLPWNKRFHYLRAVGLFIAAGAVGNMVDRLNLGYVVDFFYFELIDFPIFNVADIYVTCATAVLAALILFYYKEEELEFLFPSKKEKK